MKGLWLAAIVSITNAGALSASVPMAIGDKGSIVVPFYNNPGSVEPVAGVRVSAVPSVSGVNVLETSFLGPVSVFPGCTTYFHIDFEIGTDYGPANQASTIIIDLVHDSPNFVPAARRWTYSTQNLFRSMRGTCLETGNVFCGDYLSPDTDPPNTETVLDGPEYTAEDGKRYASANTSISFIGGDSYLVDSDISGVGETRYKVDGAAVDFDALAPISAPITVVEGDHTFYYASRDYAGNIEQTRAASITIDATAPGAPIGTKADGGSPSPWKNKREFGLSWSNPQEVSGVGGIRVKLGGQAPASNEEGVFYPADTALTYSSPDIANGQNVVWLWLEDNVGNSTPGTARQLVLRFDGLRPASAASAPAISKESLVPVAFTASDEGAPDTGSGVKQTILWHRRNGGEWLSGAYTSVAAVGAFNFDTMGQDGLWEFYTQSVDNAGNVEPAPDALTAPKAMTVVDQSAPVFSNIKASALSPDSAIVEWTTDDDTLGTIDYGRTAALGGRFVEVSYGKTHNAVITGLPSPADIYFKITAVNKAGIESSSQIGSFKTPLDISYATDIFGVIDYTQPVVLKITNPDIETASFEVDGQTWSGPVNVSQPVQIYVDPAVTGGGSHGITVNAGSYVFSSSFVVDNALRTVRLGRSLVSSGGLMSQLQPGRSGVDATSGQTAQGEMSSGENKLYLGYYSGIDPAAPAAISDLTATAGPQAGQATLNWTAPGDDGTAGTAMQYEIKLSPLPITPENFSLAVSAQNVPLPLVGGTAQSLLVSGLENGKTYYFAVRALDELANASLSNVGVVKTLEVAQSEARINDKPVVEVVSKFQGLRIEQVLGVSQEPAVVVAREAAPGQGLVFYSDIFEITPSGTFADGAQVNFRYADPGAEVEAGLGIYKYSVAEGKWLPVSGTVDQENDIIRGITYSFSLYAIFGKDKTPPVTTAELSGGVRYTDPYGNIFVSGPAKVALVTTDAVAGVARTEYRLDSSSGTFEIYVAPVQLGDGWHTVQFRGVDKAGNVEQAKSLFVMRDTLEPRVEVGFSGEFSRLPGGIILVSSTSSKMDVFVLDQPSSGSGVKKARLELDGVVSEISQQQASQLDIGRHSVRVVAEDNVGNISEMKAEIVVGDLLPPKVVSPTDNFVAKESTVAFSWQHQTNTFFSLTEYDLMLGSEPGFAEPKFTQVVSSQITISLRMDEAGFEIDGLEMHNGELRLITEHVPDYLEGTLEGTLKTTSINLPGNLVSISSITISETLNAGGIIHEFSYNAVDYYPISELATVPVPGGYYPSIRFRSKFRRPALSDPSPTLANIQITVNYKEFQYYNYYCHKHCTFCTYHCHSESIYADKTQERTMAANSQSNTFIDVRVNGDAVELITDLITDRSTGPLSGVWVSQGYSVPEHAYRIGDFLPDYDLNGGGLSFEFCRNSDAFRPIAELPALNIAIGDTIRFRANFSRHSPNDRSPVFRGVSFSFVVPPPTETKFSLPEEGKYYWRVAAKDYMGRFSAPSEERLIVYDTTPPLTERAIIGAPGQGGWYASPVSVALISTDPVAGVSATYYSLSGSAFVQYSSAVLLGLEGTHALRYYSEDAAGNKEPEKSFIAGIDLSSPTILAGLSPRPNRYGWSNTDVGVVFSGTDTVSGIAYCTSSTTVFGEGAGQQVAGVCFDSAGLSSTSTVNVNIDTTAPSIQYSRTPIPNEYGWNSGTVTLKFACVDMLSGIQICPADIVYAAESENISTSAAALDYAGNESSVLAEGIRIDRTAPASTATLAGTLKNGWYSTPVAVTLISTDVLSGIRQIMYSSDNGPFAAYQQPVAVAAEGARFVKYYAFDKAGNTELEKTVLFSIDRTAPQVGYAVTPPPNPAGWNNSGVSVVFSGTDSVSGVDACASRSVGAEGAGQQIAGWCRDMAGNISYSTSVVNIDLALPVVRAVQQPLPNADGWNNSAVKVMFSGEDSLSGVAYCSADKVLSEDGAGRVVAGSCTDRAGNVGNGALNINIDMTAPSILRSVLPEPNQAGWNNMDVTVSFTCYDSLSGIKACPSDLTLSSEGVGISTAAKALDRAGNEVISVVQGIKIDKTKPVIDISSPAAGLFVATKDRVAVHCAVKDNLDPEPVMEARLVQVEDRGSPRGDRPYAIDVENGLLLEPLGIDDGLWRLVVKARDQAGNMAEAEGPVFEVVHDILAPRTSLTVTGVRYDAAGTVFIRKDSGLKLESRDDLVELEDGIGLGVLRQSVGLSSAPALVFESTSARQGEVFATIFTAAQAGVQADGPYSLEYWAGDVLNNKEALKTWHFAVDETAPASSLGFTGNQYLGDSQFISAGTEIRIFAQDPVTNGVAAGVLLTKYRVDSGEWRVYSGSFTITAEGRHALDYYSLDRVLNTEEARSAMLVVDNTPPGASLSFGEPKAEVLGLPVLTPETKTTLTAEDPVSGEVASGLNSILYEIENPLTGVSYPVAAYTTPFAVAEQGTFVIRYWAKDNVGNVGSPMEKMFSVSTWRQDGLLAAGGLEMSGNSDIAGAVKSNGAVLLSGNARILGDVVAGTVTVSGKAQITGMRTSGAAPLATEPISVSRLVRAAVAENNNSVLAPYLVEGKLTLSSQASLIISTGSYYLKGLELTGGSSITVAGKVDIVVGGSVTISGGSSLNASGAASMLSIIVSTSSELKFSGGADISACVYAPYSDLKLAGNAVMGGHYFVRTAAVSGNGNIIQSGETLPVVAQASGGGKSKVSAIAGAGFGVLAGPSTEFRLGEVYVYPNPAKGDQIPAFHIECGIADSVKITIYTVSGRQAHEVALSGLPVALDDGNGLSYAYEYIWRGHIPSGVYLYAIEAQKAGAKLKKTGKFAVVR